MAAYLEDFALRLGCQFRRQRCCASHLLRRSACPLSVHFSPPRSLAPCLSGSIHPFRTSLVAHNVRPCFSADHEHLRALHGAGVDEDDLARGSLTKLSAAWASSSALSIGVSMAVIGSKSAVVRSEGVKIAVGLKQGPSAGEIEFRNLVVFGGEPAIACFDDLIGGLVLRILPRNCMF